MGSVSSCQVASRFRSGAGAGCLPPAVMAIVNVTPDSFSGDGLLPFDDATEGEQRLLRAVERALRAGAQWLDVGAQSTRPGAVPLSLEEERARLLPSLEAVFRAFPEASVSVDTSKAELALEAVRLGVRMVNDVSGTARPALWSALAKLSHFSKQDDKKEGGRVVLMHNAASLLHRGTAHDGGDAWLPEKEAESDLPAVLARLSLLAQKCIEAGLRRENIVLDPGLGFGKTLEQNLALLRSWSDLAALGFPLMLGASRKSFLGKLLAQASEAKSPSERLEGSLAACAAAIAGGVRILRVHDVLETVRFVRAFCPMRQGS